MIVFARLRQLFAITIYALVLYGCERATPPAEDPSSDAAAEVNAIADRYYAFILEQTPEVAYFSGVELDRHDGM